MQRDRLPYLLIPLVALVAILPLILNGCSCGHDFDFHLLSWMEAARQFTHGNLHPHWAYTPAYDAGEPRFVFYPPLSWTIGAILSLLFPLAVAPILYTWLALTASGLALHRLARDFAPPTAALIAAVLYTVNPYMLFTAYERTAYAELLAAAFIPLLLHAILRQHVTIPRIAIPVALLWLTNAPAAVMSCYALALLALLRIATDSAERSLPASSKNRTDKNSGAPYLDSEMWASRESATTNSEITNATPQSRLHLAVTTIAGTTLGLTLAAFYILPAAYERRYVQIAMALIPNMRIQDNFLFHHTGDIPHDQVLHTASLIAILLIAITAAALFLAQPAAKPGAPSSARLSRLRWASRKARPSSLQSPGTSLEPQLEHPSEPKKETSSRQKRSEVERPPSSSEALKTSRSLATLAIAITLLLTPLTAAIWSHAPELSFLQFPWRLLAILAAVCALAIALALTPLGFKPATRTFIAIAAAAALTYPAYLVFRQACDEEDTPAAREALFQSNQGTDPTDEYTPTTADNDSLAHNNPAFWLSPNPNAKAPNIKAPSAKPQTTQAPDANATVDPQPGPTPTHLTLSTPISEDLILNLRDYPAWHILRNGVPITTPAQPVQHDQPAQHDQRDQRDQRDERDDGLIVIPIPAGTSTIDITYAHTLDQTLGDGLSLLSLALLLLTLRRRSSL